MKNTNLNIMELELELHQININIKKQEKLESRNSPASEEFSELFFKKIELEYLISQTR
jgi:hypothetical protein